MQPGWGGQWGAHLGTPFDLLSGFSSQGPKGEQGPPGIPGPQGLPGIKGDKVPNGAGKHQRKQSKTGAGRGLGSSVRS